MDTSHWRPMECGDWRSQLQEASRQKIVNAIANTLKRHVMLSGQEVQYAVKKTAVEVEELIYITAISQVDYLQKISLKMKKFETSSQNPIPTANSVNPSHSIHLPSNYPQPFPYINVMHNNIPSTAIQVGDSSIEDSSIESGHWRNHVQAHRQKIVNWIMRFLMTDLPFSGHEMLQELEKIVQIFEEKLFTTATSQSAYLRCISVNILNTTRRSQNPVSDVMQLNSGSDSVTPSEEGSLVMQLLSRILHNIGSTGMQENGDSSMESSDWRDQLQADSRQWIVNKIMDTLKRHLSFSHREMQQEIEKMAVSFEEKIYTAATSQSDYMQKIFIKVPTMETSTSQYPMPYPMQSNSGANSVNPSNPGSQIMRPVNSQGQPHPNHPHPTQQPLSQAMHTNIGSTGKQAIGDSSTESADWRSQFHADFRQKIVNKLMDSLKMCIPFGGHEGLHELEKIVVRVEEKIYTAATSQSEYMRRISLKLMTMVPRSQNLMTNESNSGASRVNPFDPGSQIVRPVNSQGQPHPNHPHPTQQPLSQAMHTNIGSTGKQG